MAAVSPSWSSLVHRRHFVHTLILTLSVGMHVIDGFILIAILPSIVTDIGGTAFYTWSAMLYLVTAAIGTACGGLVTRMLDMRRSALVGVLIFLVGKVCGAVAPTMTILLLTRAVQGLGGGLMVAQAYSMVSVSYPESLRSRVLATISVAYSIGGLLGPIIGGAFAAIGWWRGAFWVMVPVLLLLAGLVWWFLLPAEVQPNLVVWPLLRLTLLGASVLCVAVTGHVEALSLRLVLVITAVLLSTMTFRMDVRASTRLFPSQALSISHPLGIALWTILLFNLTASYTGVFMPLIVQVLHGVSALWAGYFQAVLSLSWSVLAVLSAGLQGRWVRGAILVGPFLVVCGVAGQAVVVVDRSPMLLATCVAVTGAGMGLCSAHISSLAMSAARAHEADVTASSIPTMQSLGRAFGTAAAGLVANAAGLAAGISPDTVALVATWVYRLGVAFPVVVVVLSLRLLWIHRLASEA